MMKIFYNALLLLPHLRISKKLDLKLNYLILLWPGIGRPSAPAFASVWVQALDLNGSNALANNVDLY